MITTQIMGGLGNQMFQYAAGLALAHRLGVDLGLDVSWFNSPKAQEPPRRFALTQAFKLVVRQSKTGAECREPEIHLLSEPWPHRANRGKVVFKEPHFHYSAVFEQLPDNIYLSGYWQSWRYFAPVADELRADFAFAATLSPDSALLAREIAACEHSVALHVRRGDYISDPRAARVMAACGPEYYQQALDILCSRYGGKLQLYLFSDDPEWVREHFGADSLPCKVVNLPEHRAAPQHDLRLFSRCRHKILANSSFSWWAAWLGQTGQAASTDAADADLQENSNGQTATPDQADADLQKGGCVIAPRRWFNEQRIIVDDLFMPDWLVI